MFPILHLGPLVLQTPGLLLLLGIWIGLSMTGKRAHWHNMESNALDNLIMAMLIGFVIGGRLSFVAANISTFSDSPLDIFSLNFSLFQLNGGLAAGLAVGGIYGKQKGFSLWPSLDALTPCLAMLAVAIGLAHLASGSAYGQATSVAWAIELRGLLRHPSQIYESLGAAIILFAVALRKPYPIAGLLFLFFVCASAGMSLFLQAFRGDLAVTASGLRIAQIVAWLILAASLALLDRRLHAATGSEVSSPSQDR